MTARSGEHGESNVTESAVAKSEAKGESAGEGVSAGPPANMPRELWQKERDLIAARRSDPDPARPKAAGAPEGLVGLAFSGGGIRSATLSLGVLQGLADQDLLRYVDYLSTVSGGGYTGVFLGGLFHRWNRDPDAVLPRDADWKRVGAALRDPKGHPIDWLRENGRYLAPNGAGDLALAGATILRNITAIWGVLATTFLAAVLLTIGLRRAVTSLFEHNQWPTFEFVQKNVWWSPTVVLPLATLALWVIPAASAYWLIPSDETGRNATPRALPIAGVPTAGLVCIDLAAGFHFVENRGRDALACAWSGTAIAASILAIIFALAVSLKNRRGPTNTRSRSDLTTFLRSGLLVTSALTAFSLLDSAGQTVYLWTEANQLWGALAKVLGAGFAMFASVATLAENIGGVLTPRVGSRPKLPIAALASVASFLLVAVVLTSIAALGHKLAWSPNGHGTPGANLPRYEVQSAMGAEKWWVTDLDAQWSVRRCMGRLCAPAGLNLASYLAALGLSVVLSCLFGQIYTFVNRSSLAALYGARLARAYLGASNKARTAPGGQSLSVILDDDDMSLPEYEPHKQGGPLHLINVTINETIAGRSQVEMRDRKGLGMAIGPAGISVGVRHHAEWTSFGKDLRPTVDPTSVAGGPKPFRVFPEPDSPEGPVKPLWPSVGRWMAISGAAVSTGLGARTHVGVSVILGLLNLRLGHWWDSGVAAPSGESSEGRVRGPLGRLGRLAVPVQAQLIAEFLARFPGTSNQHWYLTDGGHFEDTGLYELIRRRVPFMILCDNGEDPDHQLDDIGNLVRKARTDFGAEVEFLSEPELRRLLRPEQREVIGTLRDLGFEDGALAGDLDSDDGERTLAPTRYATLARVRYLDTGEVALLLVLRPAVLGTEPVDVRNYHGQNPDFPNQSTADQFFDEAQWESYRRLGQIMANAVFGVLPLPSGTPEAGWKFVL